MSTTKTIARSIGAALTSLLLAVAGTPASAQQSQGTLRIRLNADVRSLDPGVNRDGNSDAVVSHILEGLVAFREDTSVGLLLAKALTVSPDGLTYTFTLRPGVKFQNGSPLTSADVTFAWNRYMNPGTNWRCRPEFDGQGVAKVVNVSAPDPSTVVFTLDRPNAIFLETMARTDCGGTGIYHRSSLDANGAWREPVGTGPFKVSEWKRGQYVELARNPLYSALPGKRDGNTGNKSAEVAKVRFVVIPDAAAAKAALLSDAVDVVSDVDDGDVPDYKGRADLAVASVPSMAVNAMLFQTRDPLLKDARIRRAFALALDLPQIVRTVTNGTSKASRSPIPEPSVYYSKVQRTVPARDVAAARKLLTEAGYRGQPIKLLTTKRYNYLFDVAVLAQAMAAEAGIRIDVEVLDWATLLDKYNRGDYQAMTFTYSARLDPSLSFDAFVGAKDKQSRKVWDDPDAIRMVTRSMESSDKGKRQALFDQLELKLLDETPAVFLYSETRTSAVRKNVRGFKGWPLGQPRGWGVSLTGQAISSAEK